jgi:DsbC/DsbD-like thiol-disulfide interchange protein
MGCKPRECLTEAMSNKFRFIRIGTFAAVLLLAGNASADESAWAETGQARVRLLAAGPVPGDKTLLRGGIEIRLARGWHTYWRYPGDAGVPPRFDWSGSENLASIEVLWPAPELMLEKGGVKTVGYSDAVIFPLRARATDPARAVKLNLHLQFAVCEKLCIPAEARLALDLTARTAASDPALYTAEARVPKPVRLGEGPSFAISAVRLVRGKPPRVLVDVTTSVPREFLLVAEGPDADWALPLPEPMHEPPRRYVFSIPLQGAPPGAGPIPKFLRLTLITSGEAIELEAPID